MSARACGFCIIHNGEIAMLAWKLKRTMFQIRFFLLSKPTLRFWIMQNPRARARSPTSARTRHAARRPRARVRAVVGE